MRKSSHNVPEMKIIKQKFGYKIHNGPVTPVTEAQSHSAQTLMPKVQYSGMLIKLTKFLSQKSSKKCLVTSVRSQSRKFSQNSLKNPVTNV